MYKGLKVALVIPAYNQERLIKPTLEHIPKSVDRVYVIDDCSTDNTYKVIKTCIRNDKRIRAVKHKVNMGVGQGIITGYKQAVSEGYDAAVVIGGDYQMDLGDLPNFLEPIAKGEADYVKGNRFMPYSGKKGTAFQYMPFKRLLGNSILSFITKVASGYWRIFDTQDGYTAITKAAINKVNWSDALKRYGYVSDWLVLFHTYGLKVKDAPRRAIYLKGEKQSQIKILKYITTVGPRMLWRFFWRIRKEYLVIHPVFLFYMLGLTLLPLGFLFGVLSMLAGLLGSAQAGISPAAIMIAGFFFLATAIVAEIVKAR